MTDVVIDGVRYVPESGGPPSRIGIGITTRNRPEALKTTLEKVRQHFPPGARLVVVDDASAKPVPEADFRFPRNVGIARAKNKCLELLQDCGHIFLFDDDVYPVVDDWWVPYVESPEPHLMWTFLKPVGEVGGPELTEIYRDDRHVYYHATRGAVLYVERWVLDVVGGMDPRFGKWGWEHVSWSDRIHAAGLTSSRYIDVVDSDRLFHSMDQHKEVRSTATDEDRAHADTEGDALRMSLRHSSEYVEYRELEDVVITTLFTKLEDPQRGVRMKPSTDVLGALRKSLGRRDLVVLHDELEDPRLPHTEFVRTSTKINPYFQRHLSIYQYLRDHPEIGRVWCVDATDVEMLRDPFPEMEPGRLYVGSEPSTLRNDWMLKNHPDSKIQEFFKSHPNYQLLNAGLIGGDRETVMKFLHGIVKEYFDDHIDWIMGWEHGRAGVGDMGFFNLVAYERFSDVISYGSHVNTVFKADERNGVSWWKHK